MKKGLILIFLISLVILMSACTIQLPKIKLEPKCCIASDVSTNIVTDCIHAETDVICSNQFSGKNTQFVNQKCSDFISCTSLFFNTIKVVYIDEAGTKCIIEYAGLTYIINEGQTIYAS